MRMVTGLMPARKCSTVSWSATALIRRGHLMSRSRVIGTTYSSIQNQYRRRTHPTGAAANGEVEDYKVSIGFAAPVITAPAQGSPSIVDVTGTNRVTFQWTAAAQL